MTNYELSKVPKELSNTEIDKICNKIQMSTDLRWAYKRGMKDMRDLIIEYNRKLIDNQHQ